MLARVGCVVKADRAKQGARSRDRSQERYGTVDDNIYQTVNDILGLAGTSSHPGDSTANVWYQEPLKQATNDSKEIAGPTSTVIKSYQVR